MREAYALLLIDAEHGQNVRVSSEWAFMTQTRRRTMMRPAIGLAACAVLLCIAPSGCGAIGQVVGPGGTTTEQAIEAIQSAIDSLNANSAAWQSTLNNLAAQLKANAQDLLANDVTNLMQRGIATAGVELRCNADFIGARMKSALQGILAQLKHEPAPPQPPPAICQVSPISLDMGNRPREIDFFGYDFDKGSVLVFLTHAGGEIPIDSAVSHPSHYLMTIDTSAGTSAPLCNLENRRIVLRSNGAELSSVGIARKICPAAPPPPPQATHAPILDENQHCDGGLFGCRDDRRLGGPCTAGFHRAQCSVVKLEGAGHCEQKSWQSDDEHDCGCIVHFGANALTGVNCRITITEFGDPRPAPPAPPCPCW
jgi:hypothetical protein